MKTPDVTPDEAQLLKETVERYPVTVEELRRAVRMRPTAFDMALRGLVMKGLVQLEPLEDKTFVRPMASLGPPPSPRPIDEDDPAFM
jgi:DNA-binding MarR family transcriptional regulator